MIVMGIDPSINCTGICIYDTEHNTNIYYMIVGKATKKMLEFNNKYIHIYDYKKELFKNEEYYVKEARKTKNIYNICKYIQHIINLYKPSIVYMEGVSYGSTSSSAIVDLSGLNYCIRAVLLTNDIHFKILSPTSVKKFAVGNGGVEKDVMIASWKKLDKNISDITKIKLDDLADSFFIAHYDDI